MNPVAAAVAQDFAQAVIQNAQPGEQVETFVQTATTTRIVYEANKLKDVELREARGLGVRIRTAEGRLGNFATSDFNDPAETLEMARNLASLSEPGEFELVTDYRLATVDSAPAAITGRATEAMVTDGAAIIAQLQKELPEGIHGSGLYHTVSTMELANGHGASVRYSHGEYTGYLISAITREDDQLEAYEMFQADATGVDFAPALARQLQKVRGCEKPGNLPTGNYPVLFTPNGLSTFTALQNALNGKPVAEGLSSLREALGTQALSALLTLTDDPTIAGGPVSYPIDDEGVTAKPTVLVERGVVRHFLYDQKYGKKSGQGSSGNGLRCGRQTVSAGRSYQNTISPAPSNTIVDPGTASVADLIKGMQRGLIVDSVMGVHTSNLISGDFSLNLDLAMVVENGEITGRLKDAMMSGNVFRMLKDQLAALSAERFWTGGWYAPYFLVNDVSLATTG
ncbi:MAG: TldD/PmbA family protein [bacterium]